MRVAARSISTSPAGDDSSHGRVGVDLRAGGDVAAAADREAAGSVDHGERADPTALADLGFADEPGMRVVRVVRQVVPVGSGGHRRHHVDDVGERVRRRGPVRLRSSAGYSGRVTARRADVDRVRQIRLGEMPYLVGVVPRERDGVGADRRLDAARPQCGDHLVRRKRTMGTGPRTTALRHRVLRR